MPGMTTLSTCPIEFAAPASMRPRLNAGDDNYYADRYVTMHLASMRPRLNAGDDDDPLTGMRAKFRMASMRPRLNAGDDSASGASPGRT